MMNDLERLEQKAFDENVPIDYFDFESENIHGLYYEGSIAVNSALPTTASKADVLAEELGHHYTSSGNIIDIKNSSCQKQERTARLWGYNERIGLFGLVRAYKAHCENLYEMAEFLNVTESALAEALEYYRQIYGSGITYGKYMIQFEPNLRIHTMIFILE